MYQWQKLGEKPAIDTGDIVETYSLGCTHGLTGSLYLCITPKFYTKP